MPYVLPNAIEFIEQDIEIRVESLKCEFEKLKLKINEQIETYIKNKREELEKLSDDSIKSLMLLDEQIKRMSPEELLENQDSIIAQFGKIKSDRKKKTLEIINDILNYDELDAEKLEREYFQDEITSKIKSLSLYSTKSHCFKRIIKNQTVNEMTDNVIGYLYSRIKYLNLDESSLSSDFEPKIRIIDLSLVLRSICGICEIGHDLVISDFASNSLNFVQNFDSFLFTDLEMNKLYKLNDAIKFKQYYAICTDENEDNLYICDMDLHRVMIFNSKLTKLKKIISGTPNKIEFECPRDICYYDKCIYVLDQATNSIDKFTSDGDFVKDFSLKDIVKNSFSIRIHSNIIAVVNWKESVDLFDIDFNLKEKIMINEILSICLCGNPNDESRSSFYLVAHCENGDILIYKITNQDNKIEYKQLFKKNFEKLKHGSEFMIFSKRNMIILSLGWNKSLALLEF